VLLNTILDKMKMAKVIPMYKADKNILQTCFTAFPIFKNTRTIL